MTIALRTAAAAALCLSLAAGHAMVPFGDNRTELRSLSERIAALRAAEAARGTPRRNVVPPSGSRVKPIAA